MIKKENQHTEFKQSWRDEFLKTICAFGNTQGGILYLGVDDDGTIVGLENVKKLLEDLPNKILNFIGIVCDIKIKKEKALEYITIKVNAYTIPVSYKGKFFARSGSTTQELNGIELQNFLLNRNGFAWESLIEDRATLKDIDTGTIKRFKELAAERFPAASKEKSIVNLLEKLRLLNKGKLTIWNNGELSQKLTIEKLKKAHSSYPRNQLIADVFYKASYIEAWGRGTIKILEEFKKAGLPEPLFEEDGGGMLVTLSKTAITHESLLRLGLTEREIKAVLFANEKGKITNKDLQQIAGIQERLAAMELNELVKKGVLQKFGTTGRATYYTIVNQK